jgi:hypothetical protein
VGRPNINVKRAWVSSKREFILGEVGGVQGREGAIVGGVPALEIGIASENGVPVGEVESTSGGDGVEPLVVDNVVLGANVASPEVADHANRGGVDGGEAEELTDASTRLPFGNLLVVLQTRVEDASGGTPNTGTAKELTVHLDIGEKLHGCKMGVLARDMVINPGGVVERHGPEVGVELVGPVEGTVHHHGASHVGDGLDSAFSTAILVVSADAGEGEGLTFQEGALKLLGGKDAIVSVVLFDRVTKLAEFTLEEVLGANGVGGAKGKLVVHANGTSGMFVENGAATIAMGFAALAGPEATAYGRVVVVHGNDVTDGQVVLRDVMAGGVFQVAL